ncbi:bifunctional diguanylate cyclase/phosphodiesterase [Paenibacillus sp. N3.4]|uniref:putative bifunctional diguanylate cyclase/phosphodiesterase n=1 Tax=Paenibacillus sp. N3.4 TaxID=2603222 RepID=UPI00164FB746|nr:EAL domain-containing protein [Paenibacillus sp. N3.4]
MRAHAWAYSGLLGFILLIVNLLATASYSLHARVIIGILVQTVICLFFAGGMRYLLLSKQQQEEQSRHLALLAYHDTLTGLPNRRLFDDRLKQALLHAQRSEQLAAVMFLDMDRFKDVNDTLGHAFGDQLIRSAGERLLSCLRESDTVYRQGGDEFTILLESFTKPEDVRMVASRIQAALEEPFILQGLPVSITASIGIALYPLDGLKSEELLRHADEAMYIAKNQGNNQFQFYASDIDALVKQKAYLETELRCALENVQFELRYEPQYDLSTDRLIGMEATIHWSKGQSPPLQDIDWKKVAEELGLMVPIGMWVLRTACAQMRSWQDNGFAAMRVTVAITASQFKAEHFIEELAAVLSETGIDSIQVELDLTESITSSNVRKANEKLLMLKKLGVHIAMDDLCTGLFTRSGLERMPLDRVKLDQTLIRDLVDDDENQLLAAAIIRMAQRLGLNLIAKGVDTPEQLACLRHLQCTEAQGKLFSSPLEPKEFVRLFHEEFT